MRIKYSFRNIYALDYKDTVIYFRYIPGLWRFPFLTLILPVIYSLVVLTCSEFITTIP